MRKYLQGLGVLLIVTGGLAIGHAAGAGSFTGSAPAVTCVTATIDPPTWILVNFHGTIGGEPVNITVDYNSTTFAVADISSYTTASGPIPYTLTATGNFGKFGIATSLTATGVLNCHDEPTTTTTVPPTTTTTAPPTTTTTVDIGTPCDQFARGIAPGDPRPGAQACGPTPPPPVTVAPAPVPVVSEPVGLTG